MQLPKLSERAKAAISRSTGIPVNALTVENETTVADTGIRQFKLQDKAGNLYTVALDANGNQISEDVLKQALREFHNRGFEGKLQSKLAERIRKGGRESIRVIFHLTSESSDPVQGKTDAEHQARLERVRARVSANQQPFIGQVKASKHHVIYQSLYTPMVVVSLPVQAIEALAQRDDVERVYEEGQGAVR